jgi:hypothetical protein
MFGNGDPNQAKSMRLQCKRCEVVWESHYHNDFCCSACRQDQGHTHSCWQRRSISSCGSWQPQPSSSSGHRGEADTSEEQRSGSESENEDTMAVASEAKAEVWRARHGLLGDSEFAFYFASHSEAIRNAGRAVADAWSSVRSLQLIRDKRKAEPLEDNPAEPPWKKRWQRNLTLWRSSTPPLEDNPAVAKPKWEAGSRANVREDKAKFEPVLVDIMTEASSFGMANSMAEWQAALRRRASARVGQSEKETLTRVQETWDELTSFARRGDLHIADLGVESLEDFLDESEAQARALAALRWMKCNLYLTWPVQNLLQPERNGPGKHHISQAACAKPAMVARLEEVIEKMQRQGDSKWLGLLSQWLQAIGVLRLEHIKKSTPLKLTNSTLHAWCQKGKKKGGFKWSVPARFISKPTFNWAKRLLGEWKRVPAAKRNEVGMAFDTEKFVPLTNKACIDMARTAMESLVANKEELSTHSWRRVMPTLGRAAGFSGPEMMALGSWQDKSLGGGEVREVDKEELAKKTKHEAAIILGSIMCFNAGEEIPESAYRQARQDPGNRSKLYKALEEDAVVFWKRSSPWAAPFWKETPKSLIEPFPRCICVLRGTQCVFTAVSGTQWCPRCADRGCRCPCEACDPYDILGQGEEHSYDTLMTLSRHSSAPRKQEEAELSEGEQEVTLLAKELAKVNLVEDAATPPPMAEECHTTGSATQRVDGRGSYSWPRDEYSWPTGECYFSQGPKQCLDPPQCQCTIGGIQCRFSAVQPYHVGYCGRCTDKECWCPCDQCALYERVAQEETEAGP